MCVTGWFCGVADQTTYLVYFVRMDNAKITSMDIAIDKVNPLPRLLPYTHPTPSSLPPLTPPLSFPLSGLHLCWPPQPHCVLRGPE